MKRAALLALGTAFLVGCVDSPTALDFDSIVGVPSLDISDALHQPGNSHFFFLPPMVRKPRPRPSGEFLAGLNPVVEIQCLDSVEFPCPDPLPAFPLVFTTLAGPRGERDRIREHRNDYRTSWDTKRFGIPDDDEDDDDDDDGHRKKKKKHEDDDDDGPVFRITVRVGESVLGFADVQLVEKDRGPGSRKHRRGRGRDSDPILLEDGHKLNIKFRIEVGALCEENAGTCVEETFDVAEGGTASGEFVDPDNPNQTVQAGLTISGLGGPSPAPAAFQGASIGGLFSGFGVRSIYNVGNGLLGMPIAAARAVQAATGQITVVMQDCVLLDEFGEPVLDGGGNPIPVDLDVGIPTFGPCLDIKLFDETGLRIRDLEQEATVFACVRGDLNVGVDLTLADLTPDQEELIRIHAQDELQPTVALPLRRAEGCGDPIASAGSSGFMRFARAMRDRMVSLVAPKPLHARRRRIDFLQGGAPPFFSRFQWALPAKMEKVAATDNQSALVGQAVANPPAVLVTDVEDNPVKGAEVAYVAAGGDLFSNDPVVTGADGIAPVTSWTPIVTGEIQLTASGNGIADPDNNGPQVEVFDPFTPIPGPGDPGTTPDVGAFVDLETGSLSFTATGITGTLFATDASGGNLLTVDPGTGAGTIVGPLGAGVIPSLAIDPTTGIMYAGGGGGNPDIYTVDPFTGVASFVGNTGLGIAAVGAMDFRSDGTPFAAANIAGNGGTGSDHLATINLVSGAATVVGPFGTCTGIVVPSTGGGSCSIEGIEAIAFDATGTLWGAKSARGSAGAPGLYTINTTTGAATFVAPMLDAGGNPPSGGVVSLRFIGATLFGGTARALDASGDGGRLITINPITGVFSFAGLTPATSGSSLGALAFGTPVIPPPPGTMFGTDANGGNLLTVDPGTGVGTIVGPLGVGVIPSLAIDPNTGIMYAGGGGGNPAIYTVDPFTGAASSVGSTGLGIAAVGAMDFRSDGALFAAANIAGNGGTGSDHLATINPVSGAATIVGSFGTCTGILVPSTGGGSCTIEGMEAIAFDNTGTLRGAKSARGIAGAPGLYTINTTTGAATFVAPILDAGGNPPSGGVVSLRFVGVTLFGGTARAQGASSDGGRLIIINPITGVFSFAGPIAATSGSSLGALAFGTPVIPPLPVVDQVNDPAAGTSFGCGDPSSGSIYQSFTPIQPSLARVQLRLRAGGLFPAAGVATTVNIRSGSPAGAIIGTAVAFVAGPQATGAQILVDFTFASPLTVGAGDVIEWVALPGSVLSWMGTTTDPYSGGNMFGCTGLAVPANDLNFTTFSQ